jgi:hypothetical protein
LTNDEQHILHDVLDQADDAPGQQHRESEVIDGLGMCDTARGQQTAAARCHRLWTWFLVLIAGMMSGRLIESDAW